MDWKLETLMAVRTIIAALLGAVIGWEREQHRSEAGIRTYAAVSVGACVFGLVSSHVEGGDPTRIAAQVVTGVGFLGAGVILRDRGQITGLTTAATIWSTAAVGLAIAYGMYVLGTLTGLIVFALLALHHVPGWGKVKKDNQQDKESPQP
jgi:putative Mg2+ transporter-C (MgtC) family protein